MPAVPAGFASTTSETKFGTTNAFQPRATAIVTYRNVAIGTKPAILIEIKLELCKSSEFLIYLKIFPYLDHSLLKQNLMAVVRLRLDLLGLLTPAYYGVFILILILRAITLQQEFLPRLNRRCFH